MICASGALIALLSSGCTTPQVMGTAEQICQDWRPIGVRKADQISDETAKEIVGNNVSRDAWCVQKKS